MGERNLKFSFVRQRLESPILSFPQAIQFCTLTFIRKQRSARCWSMSRSLAIISEMAAFPLRQVLPFSPNILLCMHVDDDNMMNTIGHRRVQFVHHASEIIPSSLEERAEFALTTNTSKVQPLPERKYTLCSKYNRKTLSFCLTASYHSLIITLVSMKCFQAKPR
jgi:hypothetical protein